MIEVPKYLPKDVVDQQELKRWRASLKKVQSPNCPNEVIDFIDAVAGQLPDFGQIRKDSTSITGYELKLAGMKEYNGEYIHDTFKYELPVPHLVAVDHHTAMHRIYNRKGKQGLIDYCKAHCEDQERLLRILDVHVFKQETKEFQLILDAINKSKAA